MKRIDIPIRTKTEPGRDFWIIEASSDEEAKEILKEKIMKYYGLTEEEFQQGNFVGKIEAKIKK